MTHRKKIAKRTKMALLFVLGPTVLIFGSLLVLIASNAMTGTLPDSLPASCGSNGPEPQGMFIPSETCQKDLFGEQSATQVLINNLLFVLSGVGVLLWLPGLIVGIVLFARRPKTTPVEEPTE